MYSKARVPQYVGHHDRWMPNYLVNDVTVPVNADFLVGAMYQSDREGEHERVATLSLIANSALLANFYLDLFQHNSRGKLEEA